MTVELDPELGPLVAIRLTAPGSPQATPRLIADRDIQAALRVGYYVPGADAPVTVRAEAIRISGCVVGEGTVTTTQAPRAGATIEAGVLYIRRRAQACAEAPPGVDALETPVQVVGSLVPAFGGPGARGDPARRQDQHLRGGVWRLRSLHG